MREEGERREGKQSFRSEAFCFIEDMICPGGGGGGELSSHHGCVLDSFS